MTDGMLGIVPHKTSNKGFVKKGIIPTQAFKADEEESSIAWTILSAVALGMTLVIVLAIHPALEETDLDDWVIYLIEALIGVAFIFVLIYFISPWLNEAFAEETAVDDVDPNSTPSGQESNSKIAIFAAAIAGTVYMAKRGPTK